MPLPVAGAYAHYEADTLGLSNGATVTSWPDQSGNGFDLDQTVSVLPTYETNSLNGLGGVLFAGTKTIADGSITSPPTTKTVFLVVKNPGNDGNSQSIIDVGANAGTVIAKWTAADRWIFGHGISGGDHIEFTEAGIVDVAGIWTWVQQSTGAFARWDQVQKTSGNIGALPTPTRIQLGSSGNTSSFTVYEYAVYSGVLSAGDIDLVEDYLFAKWFVAATITGTGSSTLDGVTSAGSGIFTPAAITGAGASTLDGVTSAGFGTFTLPAITGTGASTLAGVTSSGSGTVANPITGTGASTLAGVTSVGVGFFGGMFLPEITCETLTLGAACETTVLPVSCAILSLGVECEQ